MVFFHIENVLFFEGLKTDKVAYLSITHPHQKMNDAAAPIVQVGFREDSAINQPKDFPFHMNSRPGQNCRHPVGLREVFLLLKSFIRVEVKFPTAGHSVIDGKAEIYLARSKVS